MSGQDGIYAAETAEQTLLDQARTKVAKLAGAVLDARAAGGEVSVECLAATMAAMEELVAMEDPGPSTSDRLFLELQAGRLDKVRGEMEASAPSPPLGARADFDKDRQPPQRQWLVDGVIPTGRYGILAGKGGNGKSRIALDLARAMFGGTEGVKWLCWDVMNMGDVVWCSWEDEYDEVARRLGEYGRELANEQLHYVDLAERGPLWAPDPGGSGHTSTMSTLTSVGAMVRAECERVKAKLLVIDPLAAAFASNENDRGLVRAFVASWDGWARRTECTVIAIAHPPKDRTVNYSGSTDWESASRFMLTMRYADKQRDSQYGPNLRVLEHAKSNYGALAEAIYLEWNSAVWGDKQGGFVHAGEWAPARKDVKRGGNRADNDDQEQGGGYDPSE